MFRYEYGYLHCIFYSLYGLFVNTVVVKSSLVPPEFRLSKKRCENSGGTNLDDHGNVHYHISQMYFPHTLCDRVFVDQTCHDHEADGRTMISSNAIVSVTKKTLMRMILYMKKS